MILSSYHWAELLLGKVGFEEDIRMLETPLLLHQEQQVPHVNSLSSRPQG